MLICFLRQPSASSISLLLSPCSQTHSSRIIATVKQIRFVISLIASRLHCHFLQIDAREPSETKRDFLDEHLLSGIFCAIYSSRGEKLQQFNGSRAVCRRCSPSIGKPTFPEEQETAGSVRRRRRSLERQGSESTRSRRETAGE